MKKFLQKNSQITSIVLYIIIGLLVSSVTNKEDENE
jgi:high-affinity Fe2+/Pb2+ permease